MRRALALVLKFKTNLLRKVFPKGDKAELHQQIGTSEQLLSIAEMEIAGKKIIKIAQNRAFTEGCKSQTKQQIISNRSLC